MEAKEGGVSNPWAGMAIGLHNHVADHPCDETCTFYPAAQEATVNTHAAFETREGEKDKRLAGGSEAHCERVLSERQAADPELTGYVRPLTEQELK